MKFIILKSKSNDTAYVQYSAKDNAFDSFPLNNTDINISMAYMNLGVDSENMMVKSVWGFSPKESWIEQKLIAPNASNGELKLIGNYKAGLSWRIDKDDMWTSYYNKKNGWFCIGNPITQKNDEGVKINKNTIIILNDVNELKAIWINSIFV